MKKTIQFPKGFPILETEKLKLTMLSLADCNNFFKLRSNPNFVKYLGLQPMKEIDEAKEYIQALIDKYKVAKSISWKISLKENPNLIGYIGFWSIDHTHFRAEIGFGIEDSYRKKGLMSEAIQAVLKYSFEELGLHSIKANVDIYNQASKQLLLKHQFIKEAHFRENYYFDGKFIDSAFYCIIKSDWSNHT